MATRRTMAANGCSAAEGLVEYLVADWLQGTLRSQSCTVSRCSAIDPKRAFLFVVAVAAAGGPYDALVTNPPFAQSGKYNRRYFIDELILNAHKLLTPAVGGCSHAGGSQTMVFVQSSAANVPLTMERLAENGWEGARIVLRRDYP